MDTARYIEKDSDSKNIAAENITPKEYEKIYKEKLYCEYDNCNAEILFNERQKRGFLRYFSTKPGSNHNVGCPNEISHSGNKSPTIKIMGNDVNVSDKHISDALTDAYKIFYEKLHPSDNPKIKNKNHKKSTSPISKPENGDNPTVSVIFTPTSNGTGKTIVEGKEPYIYKREVSEIKDDDKDSYKEVHSLVEGIRLYENEVYIDLKGLDGSKFSVYISTPFKTSYEQEFKLLKIFGTYITQQKKASEPIICTSVGEIMKINNKPVIQIYSYRHLKLDNLSLYQIINKLSNTKH